ncbi:hypothetical protein HPB50_028008 [Hyalomma asiaticum]|nr:hypothetical protein HPB50_028008 [Hyalomma asiaticum]
MRLYGAIFVEAHSELLHTGTPLPFTRDYYAVEVYPDDRKVQAGYAGICDADLWVLHVGPYFAGSCHDSIVWHRDPLRRQLEAELRPVEYLLGGFGYPLEPWLLTPVPGRPPPGSPESRYNKEHAAMINVVERCIGVRKSKFRCLQHYRTRLYNPDRAAPIIAACAALHNIALTACEPAFAEDDDEGEEPHKFLFRFMADPPEWVAPRYPRTNQPTNQPSQQSANTDRPPSPDRPPPPMWAPSQQDVSLRGKMHRNHVVDLFIEYADLCMLTACEGFAAVYFDVASPRQCNAATVRRVFLVLLPLLLAALCVSLSVLIM